VICVRAVFQWHDVELAAVRNVKQIDDDTQMVGKKFIEYPRSHRDKFPLCSGLALPSYTEMEKIFWPITFTQSILRFFMRNFSFIGDKIMC